MSRICPDLTSRCVAVQVVDQNAVDHFDVFVCQRCVLLSSKRTKSIFGRVFAPDPAGELRTLPIDPIVGWRGDREGDTPLHTFPLRRLRLLDLGVFAASKSVPNFHHRFMVTLLICRSHSAELNVLRFDNTLNAVTVTCCLCADMDALPKPTFSDNLIYENRREVKHVVSVPIPQDFNSPDGVFQPITLTLKRGALLLKDRSQVK